MRLATIECLVILDKIMLQLKTDFCLYVSKNDWIRLGYLAAFGTTANFVKFKWEVEIPLILDCHIVYDYANNYNIMQGVFVLKFCCPRTVANLACKTPKALSLYPSELLLTFLQSELKVFCLACGCS
jgi:hypothetical protein